jgi:hypothetical protein
VAGGDATPNCRSEALEVRQSGRVSKDRLTPQEKKVLSYQRDRRNAYGEAGARSRYAVRRRKQGVNRANRRMTAQSLSEHEPGVSELDPLSRRPKRWQKSADVRLSTWLTRWNRRRMERPIPMSALVDEALRRNRKANRNRPIQGETAAFAPVASERRAAVMARGVSALALGSNAVSSASATMCECGPGGQPVP